MSLSDEEILARAGQIKAAGGSAPRAGRDPVNQPMINNWVEALGDPNPIYVSDDAARAAGHEGIVAPPAMIQVWTMVGLRGHRTADDPLELADAALAKQRLADALANLPERERLVLELRFGIGSDEGERSLEQVGKQLGLTRERVRQLESTALDRLSRLLERPSLSERGDLAGAA